MFLLNLACVLALSFVTAEESSVGVVAGRVVALGGDSVGALSNANLALLAVKGFGQEVSGQVARTTADIDGSFRFDGVRPGVYFLESESEGYKSTRSLLFTVRSADLTTVDLCRTVDLRSQFAPGVNPPDVMELSGSVRSAGGPVADASVAILLLPLPDGIVQLRSDRKGQFGPVLMTSGDHVITVFKPGYKYKTKLVSSGARRVVDFHLHRSDD